MRIVIIIVHKLSLSLFILNPNEQSLHSSTYITYSSLGGVVPAATSISSANASASASGVTVGWLVPPPVSGTADDGWLGVTTFAGGTLSAGGGEAESDDVASTEDSSSDDDSVDGSYFPFEWRFFSEVESDDDSDDDSYLRFLRLCLPESEESVRSDSSTHRFDLPLPFPFPFALRRFFSSSVLRATFRFDDLVRRFRLRLSASSELLSDPSLLVSLEPPLMLLLLLLLLLDDDDPRISLFS